MNGDFPEMDKKICSIPLAKTSAQDGSSKVPQSKFESSRSGKSNSRRRFDSPVIHHNASSKGDGCRRPPVLAPKSKYTDKRNPAGPRGINAEAVAVNTDGEPEFGSLQSHGGRKFNADHLVKFSLAPRERYHPTYGSSPPYFIHKFNRQDSEYRKYAKQDFVQANCQFLVGEDLDYTKYYNDSDLPVDWSIVEQVLLRVSCEGTVCPICLSPPNAAKITECGHIFCLPCVLQYLVMNEKPDSPCPICYVPINHKSLRSVETTIGFDVDVGDHIDMQLMCRSKNSMFVEPVAKSEHFDWIRVFSKIIPVEKMKIREQITQRDTKQLETLLQNDPMSNEMGFVDQALTEVRNRNLLHNPVYTARQFLLQYKDQFGMTKLTRELNKPIQDEFIFKENYYFYQACDGQPIYMLPLNLAMFLQEYGQQVSEWPQQISLKVIDKEYMSVSVETRKRYKVFSHLPLNASFQLVEVELAEPLISERVIKEFRHQLESREANRAERKLEDIRVEKMMKNRNKKLEKLSHLTLPKFESMEEFPIFQMSDSQKIQQAANTERAGPRLTPDHFYNSPYISVNMNLPKPEGPRKNQMELLNTTGIDRTSPKAVHISPSERKCLEMPSWHNLSSGVRNCSEMPSWYNPSQEVRNRHEMPSLYNPSSELRNRCVMPSWYNNLSSEERNLLGMPEHGLGILERNRIATPPLYPPPPEKQNDRGMPPWYIPSPEEYINRTTMHLEPRQGPSSSFAEVASKPSMRKSTTFPENNRNRNEFLREHDSKQKAMDLEYANRRRLLDYDPTLPYETGLEEDKCAPEFSVTLSDAISKAFQSATMNNEHKGAHGGTSAVNEQKKKKKKNKGKFVFSTGGAEPFSQ